MLLEFFGPTCTYRYLYLKSSEFPCSDDDLIGKIVNAITASVHPKECSVNALKSYVVEFYPQFGVKDKPFLLRKALERAVSKDLIR